MSQHDYSIANQTTPSFRSDLNDALGAVVTNNSGTTEPSVTYANQWWYDTANDTLKIRSEADDAWISVGYLDQSTNEFKPYIGASQITALLDEDDMSSDSDTGVPTQQSVKAYVDASSAGEQPIGVGQTWTTVSRSAGTSYQNTTGQSIQIVVKVRTTNDPGGDGEAALQVSEDNSTWITVYRNRGIDYHWIIIPSGYYWRVSNVGSGGTATIESAAQLS